MVGGFPKTETREIKTKSGELWRVETATGRTVKTVPQDGSCVVTLCLSSDDKTLGVKSCDGPHQFLNAETLETISALYGLGLATVPKLQPESNTQAATFDVVSHDIMAQRY
ncbi:MAG: hypothetical protein JOZ57_16495 [Abitibacteriaceae bacterium]|nr:hypothetical protein [Abditibacteriaceae bacterium]